MLFYKTAEQIDQQEDELIGELWSDYLGIHDHPALALRYFNIVRDVFYSRLNFKNFDYRFLHSLVTEAKAAVQPTTESDAAVGDR